MEPYIRARVRHMDNDRPVEIRIYEAGMSTSFALTASDAALFLMQFQRVMDQAVAE
jgi:hypothetical protein